jgi:elongation factor G
MTKVDIAQKRNVALVGHGGCGKTTLAEAMLFASGAINRMGTVSEGNTASDFAAEEVKRRISIWSTVLPLSFDGMAVNLVDTPGYIDFVGEMISSLRVADSAVIVVNALAGIETQTERAWDICQELGLPRAFFIAQVDKENASFERTLAELAERWGTRVAPLYVPVGNEKDLTGVVDVLAEKAYITKDGAMKEAAVPEDLKAKVADARLKLVESIVEQDEKLFERYLADEKLSEGELIPALRAGVLAGKIVPVLCGAAPKLIGVFPLLNLIVDALPSPAHRGAVKGVKPGTEKEDSRKPGPDEPFSARVFKVMNEPHIGELIFFRIYSGTVKPGDSVYNSTRDANEKITAVISMRGKQREDLTQASAGDLVATVKLRETRLGDTLCDKEKPIVFPPLSFPSTLNFEAIKVESKGDLEKVAAALNKIVEEDPTLKVHLDHETLQLQVSGMGELHLGVVASKLEAKTGIKVEWAKPKLAYRETIRTAASAQGKYKKQTGGRGQFGDVWLELSPMPMGQGFEFVNKIVGGVVPSKFVPAVEKGVVETMSKGVIAGYPVVDIRVTLYDGSYHSVDSSEMAFKIAASMGFKKAFMEAKPVLLEPIYNVDIIAPHDNMGDIMGDLNSRRGRVMGMDSQGKNQVIKAQVPLSELYKYINTLRSITQGRGSFTMEFSHYEEVPSQLAQEIVAAYQKEKAGKEEE